MSAPVSSSRASASADLRVAIHRRAIASLWMANALGGVALGWGYMRHVPENGEPLLWFFGLAALISTVATLTAIPGLLFLLLAGPMRSARTLVTLQVPVWTAFQVLLFTDTRVYNVFRYHLGAQVWNVLATPGSEDSVSLGWQVWLSVSLGLSGVGFVQWALWRFFLKKAESHVTNPAPHRSARLLPAAFSALLLFVFVDKTIYAQADISRDRQVTSLGRVFPLYARLPVDDLASQMFDVQVEERPEFEVTGIRLNYPSAPALDPEGPRPNVFVVVIDCWRSDALSEELTPELERFAASARRFDDHVSGGNSTRYGLFSLLYGLPGNYWFPVHAEQRTPVLMDALLNADYDVRVFSSASMHYPELRETAWADVPNRVHDDYAGLEPWARDEEAAAACKVWLADRVERGEESPFFGFMLLDSAHQKYSYPPTGVHFQPTTDVIDYMKISHPDGLQEGEIERIHNRYRNAVRHVDQVASDLLASLSELGLDENTLVVVTGDHGEEFLEHGFFGHTSAFTPEQVQVPFLLRGPGVTPGVETRPTSHVDFAPTLLELLGAPADSRASYSCGANLLDPPAWRERFLSGWNELGLWTEDCIIRVPLSLLEFDVECYDYDWRFLADDSELLRRHGQALDRLATDCNRFLR